MYTQIRGSQIKNVTITATQLATDAVETLKIKDANVTLAKLASAVQTSLGLADSALQSIAPASITETELNSTVNASLDLADSALQSIGSGTVTDDMLNDDVATGLAGDGLSASSGVMALDLNELTGAVVNVANDSIGIIDADDNSSKKESIADLATAMAGSGITATAGVLSADAVSDNIVEGDIQVEDESANCNGVTVAFTLSNTPITSSVQVFLNGALQAEGSGKDYDLTGTTVTFVIAPETNDVLLIHYIINN